MDGLPDDEGDATIVLEGLPDDEGDAAIVLEGLPDDDGGDSCERLVDGDRLTEGAPVIS